ncbi:hypothetical protein BDW02DRAFT_493675 [Decorospora gaudefroyi]|uniref:rRNA-processing protein FYV7 n=1 Tax=Decorospora gaudefroyi TaxID=184978 RepID=A0A6A5KE66_9PLEO|nr:hypothetical protein BDW02DRAFT_493675 [Decorospora gaudefroyi]
MAPKWAHEGGATSSAKKQKKGFAIGPANLPDGMHRRKIKKIKQGLIEKAKLKKQYAKLKAHQDQEAEGPRQSVHHREAPAADDTSVEPADEPTNPAPEPSLDPHPDRVAMLEEESPEPQPKPDLGRRQRRPRPQPFKKESELAQKKKEEAEARQKARDKAANERATKMAERKRFRKTMAKARGGPNGRRKLGKESTVLLAKAQKLMGKT